MEIAKLKSASANCYLSPQEAYYMKSEHVPRHNPCQILKTDNFCGFLLLLIKKPFQNGIYSSGEDLALREVYHGIDSVSHRIACSDFEIQFTGVSMLEVYRCNNFNPISGLLRNDSLS